MDISKMCRTVHDSRIDPIGDSLTGSDTLIAAIEEKPIAPKAVIEMRPKRVSAATSLPVSPELPPVSDAPPVSDPLPVSDSLPVSDCYLIATRYL